MCIKNGEELPSSAGYIAISNPPLRDPEPEKSDHTAQEPVNSSKSPPAPEYNSKGYIRRLQAAGNISEQKALFAWRYPVEADGIIDGIRVCQNRIDKL